LISRDRIGIAAALTTLSLLGLSACTAAPPTTTPAADFVQGTWECSGENPLFWRQTEPVTFEVGPDSITFVADDREAVWDYHWEGSTLITDTADLGSAAWSWRVELPGEIPSPAKFSIVSQIVSVDTNFDFEVTATVSDGKVSLEYEVPQEISGAPGTSELNCTR
jgi:hypothetical protein